MSIDMGKDETKGKKKGCIIIWEDGVKEKLHKACNEYFSSLPEEKIKEYFRIILRNE